MNTLRCPRDHALPRGGGRPGKPARFYPRAADNPNVHNLESVYQAAGTWQENALSNSFAPILEVQPRQQAELAVRFIF